jgi:hypothetical protein
MCRIWSGREGWATKALLIDCYSRELLGWHLSRNGRSKMAESAPEQTLILRCVQSAAVERQITAQINLQSGEIVAFQDRLVKPLDYLRLPNL